ncbi:MAG: AAA family ATPase [Deltaproteobacteria bacterium]|nr:AAA family ATPase [Deltaproteobacteria bacterium]
MTSRHPGVAEAASHLIALWRSEREAERRRFREERALLSWKERLARGLALADLIVVETMPAAGGRIVVAVRPETPGRLPFDRHSVRLRAGDPVVLFRQSPDEPGAVPAVVERWRGQTLGIALDQELPDALEDEPFRLEREAPEATFARGEAALSALRDARGDLLAMARLVYGDGALEVEPRRAPTGSFDEALDAVQRAAITRAVTTGPIALIHGPPGTGKTRCLVEIIRQAHARGERVLVTAASNVAVDNLAERLIAHELPVIRLGHPARVLPSVEDATLDARLDAHEASRLARGWVAEAAQIRKKALQRGRGAFDREARERRREALQEANRLVKDARHHLRRVEQAILDRAPIVCCTLTGADHPGLRARDDRPGFELVILDEATQAPDPLAWIALRLAPRAILAGDPHQLPPTIIDPAAERAGLGTTLFERLVARHGAGVVTMLETQHRMHAAIMAFPSAAHYGGRLVAHPAVAGHTLAGLGVLDDPLRDAPFVFIDIAGQGWTEVRLEGDPSTKNPELAARTAREVRRLVSRGLAPERLAVLTPYDAHVGELRRHLAELVEQGLEVGSIDGFQGREKEAVVVDLVRSNDAGDIGFLADVRRMNVALTRARRCLIVLGDSATLGASRFYEAFLAAVESHGLWVSSFADDASAL